MPDMERLIDKLALDLATTPERKAWVEGWVAGKRTARKQMAIVVAFVATITVIVVVTVTL